MGDSRIWANRAAKHSNTKEELLCIWATKLVPIITDWRVVKIAALINTSRRIIWDWRVSSKGCKQLTRQALLPLRTTQIVRTPFQTAPPKSHMRLLLKITQICQTTKVRRSTAPQDKMCSTVNINRAFSFSNISLAKFTRPPNRLRLIKSRLLSEITITLRERAFTRKAIKIVTVCGERSSSSKRCSRSHLLPK